MLFRSQIFSETSITLVDIQQAFTAVQRVFVEYPNDALLLLQQVSWEEIFCEGEELACCLLQHGQGVCDLLDREVSLQMLYNVRPHQLQQLCVENSAELAYLMERLSFEGILSITPTEWRNYVIQNGFGVTDLLMRGFTLDSLYELSPSSWRTKIGRAHV